MKAQDLIDRSISQYEIAHGAYAAELAAELATECDDHVSNGTVEEFWGTRDGEEWRVHLDRDEA